MLLPVNVKVLIALIAGPGKMLVSCKLLLKLSLVLTRNTLLFAKENQEIVSCFRSLYRNHEDSQQNICAVYFKENVRYRLMVVLN